MSAMVQNTRELEALAASCGNWGKFVPCQKDPDTSKLWVVFSHVRIPEGKFAQSKVMNMLEGHKLYLNCAENQWYTKGIGSFSTSLPDTVHQILDVTQPFKTTFVGHSMGAYLSLLIGKLSENSRYISTSPELYLGLAHSRSFENGVNGSGAMRNLDDISSGFHKSNSGCVFFGAYDPIDCYFLAQDMTNNIGSVFEVPHHHGVTEYFTGNKLYHEILTSNVDSDLWRSLEERNHLFDRGHHGTQKQYLHFYNTFRDYLDGAEASVLKERASTFARWNNPGWQELRSKVWHQLNEPVLSFEAARKAYHYQPDLIQFIDVYGNACLRYGEKSKLCDVIDSMSEAQRQHTVGKRLIENTLEQFGVNFYQNLIHDPEAQPSLTEFNGETPPDVTKDERPADAETLYKLNTNKKFEAVLSLTSPTLNENFRYDIELAPARAIALIYYGDSSAGLRLLQVLDNRGAKDKYFARALITAAQKLHSVDLLQRYLKLDIPGHWKLNFSKILKPCLQFVRSPALIANILVELAKYKYDNLESTIEELLNRYQSIEMQRSVAQLIPLYANHDAFEPEYRVPLLKFMKDAKLDLILHEWLPEISRSRVEIDLLQPNT